MENIYFQPNKENSEFLAKLEKLDEYTIPQILERMVDHFRTLPELEDALNNKSNYFSFIKHSLDKQISDDFKILNIIDLGKERINQLHGPLPDDGHNHHNHKH